ncbi:hypothetical protein VTN02DRAFT_3314 [Thermoascus thermophilus]
MLQNRVIIGPERLAWDPNCEAVLAHLVGKVKHHPCWHCVASKGLFTECIVVKDHIKRSCTNCHWNSSGGHCSFHTTSHGNALLKLVWEYLSGAFPETSIMADFRDRKVIDDIRMPWTAWGTTMEQATLHKNPKLQ